VEKEQDQCEEDYESETKHLVHNLSAIVNIDYGLLDALFSHGVLTGKQVEHIKEKTTHVGKAIQLIDEITSGSNAKKNEEQFLTVLDETQQSYVSNFIRSFGHRTADHGDDWPLHYCPTERHKFVGNCVKLIDLVDSRNGLLEEMLSADCINSREKQTIESKVTDAEQIVNSMPF